MLKWQEDHIVPKMAEKMPQYGSQSNNLFFSKLSKEIWFTGPKATYSPCMRIAIAATVIFRNSSEILRKETTDF